MGVLLVRVYMRACVLMTGRRSRVTVYNHVVGPHVIYVRILLFVYLLLAISKSRTLF